MRVILYWVVVNNEKLNKLAYMSMFNSAEIRFNDYKSNILNINPEAVFKKSFLNKICTVFHNKLNIFLHLFNKGNHETNNSGNYIKNIQIKNQEIF